MEGVGKGVAMMRMKFVVAALMTMSLSTSGCETACDEESPCEDDLVCSSGFCLSSEGEGEEGEGEEGEGEEGEGEEGEGEEGEGEEGEGEEGEGEEGEGETDWWQPTPGTTWQWQLSGDLDTSYDVVAYDVDLAETDTTTINDLHADGRIVICYFSAGTYESYRDDVDGLSEDVKGGSLDPPFQDELWLDTDAPSVRELVTSRLDVAVAKGCDAVEPDNVDGYQNDNQLGLTAVTQLSFNRFVAAQAHLRGLSVGLKNDLDQLESLVDDFDWALNEECYSYDECERYSDNFIAQNKAVFHAEYVTPLALADVCLTTQPLQLSTLIKNIELDASQFACP
jgi:hypothetical protein